MIEVSDVLSEQYVKELVRDLRTHGKLLPKNGGSLDSDEATIDDYIVMWFQYLVEQRYLVTWVETDFIITLDEIIYKTGQYGLEQHYKYKMLLDDKYVLSTPDIDDDYREWPGHDLSRRPSEQMRERNGE